jgi:hypothetical protein|tara:strand:+ start:1993 stop:2259 length:267 start_codon:yes stop_codon:yes gene_type:complete
MKITTPHGDFKIRELSFADRRKLHRLEIKAVAINGEVDQTKYFDVLDWVMNFAFEDPEKSLSKLDDNEVDEILATVYQEYKGISKKKT